MIGSRSAILAALLTLFRVATAAADSAAPPAAQPGPALAFAGGAGEESVFRDPRSDGAEAEDRCAGCSAYS